MRVGVVFPVWFTLTEEQVSEYKNLSENGKEAYLLDLADHYLLTSSVKPILDYVENCNESGEPH